MFLLVVKASSLNDTFNRLANRVLPRDTRDADAESAGAEDTDRGSLDRGPMSTKTPTGDESTDTDSPCVADDEHCGGPDADELPCFPCYLVRAGVEEAA